MSDDIYRQQILEHYKQPTHRGVIADATISHEEDNPLCGDKIRIDLLVRDEVVQDAKFSGQGCAISQASADMLIDLIKGRTLSEVRRFDKQVILEMLGIPLTAARLKCALLSLKVVKVGAYGLSAWHEEEE